MVFNNAINQNVTGLVYSVGDGTFQGKNISITTQVFSSSGTWTKPTGLIGCIVECVGGGAGGGGAESTNNSQIAAASGGGSGGYCKKTFAANDLTNTVAITIGVGGNGGAAGANNGTNGGATSFDAYMTANGGNAGIGAASSPTSNHIGGLGGTTTGGDINCTGSPGGYSFYSVNGTSHLGLSGYGGISFFGSGASGQIALANQSAGQNASVYGGGGSGAVSTDGGTSAAGGNGSDGVCIITNYILS